MNFLPALNSFWPLLILIGAILVFDAVLVVIFRKFGEIEKQQLEFNRRKEDALAPAFKQAEEMLLAARGKAEKVVEEAVAQADGLAASARDEAARMVSDAQAEATGAISKAKKEAAEIVGGAQANNDEIQKLFHQKIDEVASEQAAEFGKVTGELTESWKGQLKKISDDDINTIKSVSDTIEKAALAEMEEFKNILAKRTVELEGSVEQKVSDAYGAMLERVRESELKRLAKVDQKIVDVLQDVSRSVLGKTLPLGDHEKLVYESLEKAKKEKILG
jgi:cell division septum initiation protein DivIVA